MVVLNRAVLTCMLCLLLALPAWGEEPGEVRMSAEERARVERILELRAEIEALMESLPPHLREEVDRLAAEAKKPAALEVEAAPAPPPPPALEPASCNALWPFDSDADGRVDGADRYWRYLYLWVDRDGDAEIDERELESVYERGVRWIAVSLRTYGKTKKDAVGQVEVIDDAIRFDLTGDGFAAQAGDGILVVDASRLARGDGPRLLGPEGEALEGYQAFRPDLSLAMSGGETIELDCP